MNIFSFIQLWIIIASLHICSDLSICRIERRYVYWAVAYTTRNALNCINCPILCKRCSSFRALLRYSSSLSLIHFADSFILCQESPSPSRSIFLLPSSLSVSFSFSYTCFVVFPSLSVCMTFTSLSFASPSFLASRSVVVRALGKAAALSVWFVESTVYICLYRIISAVRANRVTRRQFYSTRAF